MEDGAGGPTLEVVMILDLHRQGHELWPVVRTDGPRPAVGDEQVAQHVDNDSGPQLATDPDAQAFAGELVDNVQQPQLTPVPGAVLDEVVGP